MRRTQENIRYERDAKLLRASSYRLVNVKYTFHDIKKIKEKGLSEEDSYHKTDKIKDTCARNLIASSLLSGYNSIARCKSSSTLCVMFSKCGFVSGNLYLSEISKRKKNYQHFPFLSAFTPLLSPLTSLPSPLYTIYGIPFLSKVLTIFSARKSKANPRSSSEISEKSSHFLFRYSVV